MQQPPTNRKFRKDRKGVLRGSRSQQVEYGAFGIQATSWGRINPRHIETIRRIIVRRIRVYKNEKQKVWIRVFADKPVSKKPLEVRQGKGKGRVLITGYSESDQVQSYLSLRVCLRKKPAKFVD